MRGRRDFERDVIAAFGVPPHIMGRPMSGLDGPLNDPEASDYIISLRWIHFLWKTGSFGLDNRKNDAGARQALDNLGPPPGWDD